MSTAAYPPGSTFKLAVAATAMRRGQLSIGSYMSTSCLGAFGYGNRRFRCWKSNGHGPLSLAGAITESCNVYFYQAGMRLGLDALLEGAASYGFDRATGIDLPYETPGAFPPWLSSMPLSPPGGRRSSPISPAARASPSAA